MTKLGRFLVLSFLIAFSLLGLANETKAATACNDPKAVWNQDQTNPGRTLSPLFQCGWVNDSSSNYTKNFPTIIQKGKTDCTNKCTGNRPPSNNCRCIRVQDCNSLGGICFSGGKNPKVTKADTVIADGEPYSKYKKLGYTVNILYRCPGDSDISCWVKPQGGGVPDGDPDDDPKDKTVQQPGACDFGQNLTAYGGPGYGGTLNTTHQITMGTVGGKVDIRYDFYKLPDRIEVKDSSGKIIARTETFKPGTGSLTFEYKPNSDTAKNFIKVTVFGDPNSGGTNSGKTSWEYSIVCPGDPPFLIPPPTSTIPYIPPPVNISDCCQQIVPPSEDGNYGLNHFLQVAINVYECILCMVAALMLLMFVVGGFIFLTSAGNQARVGLGKKIIIGAIIGGIIVFASILIVNFSVKALGGSFVDESRLQIRP